MLYSNVDKLALKKKETYENAVSYLSCHQNRIKSFEPTDYLL